MIISYKDESDNGGIVQFGRVEPSDSQGLMNCWDTSGKRYQIHLSLLRFGAKRLQCSKAFGGKSPLDVWRELRADLERQRTIPINVKIVINGGLVSAVYADGDRQIDVEVINIDDLENCVDEEEIQQHESQEALAEQLRAGAFPQYREVL